MVYIWPMAYLLPASPHGWFVPSQRFVRLSRLSSSGVTALRVPTQIHPHRPSPPPFTRNGNRVTVESSADPRGMRSGDEAGSTPVPLPSLPSKSVPVPGQDVEKSRPPGFWQAAAFELAAGLVAILMSLVTRVPVLGPNFTCTLPALAYAVHLTIPFALTFWVIDKLPNDLGNHSGNNFRTFFQSRSVLDIALFCACVAFGEELLFRGFLLSGLCAVGVPAFGAALVSSLIFGALHAYTTLYIVLASMAGFIFGAMFLQTGNLLTPLVVHFLYDFFTIIALKFRWRSLTTTKK